MGRSVIWGIILAIVTCVSSSENNFTEGEPLKIVMATHKEVTIVDLENATNVITIASGLSGATAVDYDIENKVVVWSDVSADTISKAYIETGEISVIARERIGTPDGLALDWIHGYVYWTDTGTDTISVATLEGQLRKSLIDTHLKEPRAIVVDPLEGWMFWTDWGSNAKIEKAGMDGSHRSTIVSSGLGWPNGLSIDTDSRKIYWADAQVDNICSSDYDGSNVKVILTSADEVKHPFAMDIFGDWMYWTDWHRDNIYKANKVTGGNIEMVFRSSSSSPMGIRVIHDSKQPKGINYCEEFAECSHFCLPVPRISADSKNFTCACPDGMELSENGRNCTALPTTSTIAPTTTKAPCPYDPFFTCAKGKCIKLHWVCDGDNDCGDNSDELNCDASTTSLETEAPSTTKAPCPYDPFFTCANGRCVKLHWVCDGDNDCRDNSDEQNCGRSTTPTSSTTRRSTTIRASRTTVACPSYAFRCDNGRCVRRGFVCDRDNDCGDGSDERNCDTKTDTTTESVTYVILRTMPSFMTSSANPLNKNETIQTIQERRIGTGRIAGTVFGILVALTIVAIVVGFLIYKRRNSSITNFENPVYRKESEVPLRFESNPVKESVILPI